MSFLPQALVRLFLPLLTLPFLLTVPALAQTAPAASDVLREITDVVGLKARFELRVTHDIDNAAAVVYDGKRYLLYNPDFLASVNRAGHTDWAGISILAHEMGHHLNGHTLRTGGSKPADELESDEFSGFVLRKLGASLAQAQAALASIAEEEGTATHPGRSPRLKAISEGWQRAEAQIVASNRTASPSATPAVLADAPALPELWESGVVTSASVTSPTTRDTREAVAIKADGTPVRLVGQLTFTDNPSQRFYLTSGLKVLRVNENESAEVVGRVTRTSSTAFPFVLTDAQQRRLFITPRGDVYDKAGQRVAKLHDSM